MTNTPRTDAAIIAADGRWTYELKEEMQAMERELAAANERIKRLEDAGDLCLDFSFRGMHVLAEGTWTKAKEAKP